MTGIDEALQFIERIRQGLAGLPDFGMNDAQQELWQRCHTIEEVVKEIVSLERRAEYMRRQLDTLCEAAKQCESDQ